MIDLNLILLLLRILSALLLLAFVGGIGWLIYRDLELNARLLAQQHQVHGYLHVLVNDTGNPPVGTRIPLLTVTRIGRASHNTIVLQNEYASGEHALLTWRGSQWWLEDLGSRNGTQLNGVSLAETAVVTPGDVIAVGNTEFRLEE